jgi:hypothetical protein
MCGWKRQQRAVYIAGGEEEERYTQKQHRDDPYQPSVKLQQIYTSG